MGMKRNRRIIATILSLMIAISTFNVGNGSEHVVKAEGNEDVTESVIEAGGDNAEISEENTEGVSTEGINSTEAGTENSITEEADAPVTQEDSTEGISKEESTQTGTDKSKNSDGKFQGDGYTVDFVLDNEWESGFNATVTITNTSDAKIENWSLILPLNNNFSNIWNAVVADTYDDFYVIKNAGWNQDIQVNGSVSFGITSYEKFAGFPKYYTIVGKKVETKTSDYTVEYAVTDVWEDGLIGRIKITNTRDTAIEDWRLHFIYAGEIVEIWDAVVVSHENNVYDISCENYNQNIQAGKSVTFGFKISSGKVGEPAELKLEEYSNNKVDKYIALMGKIKYEEKTYLNLFATSSESVDKYIFYCSSDDKDYKELGTNDKIGYLSYELSEEITDSKMYIYVLGCGNGLNISSEKILLEFKDDTYTLLNYDTDDDGLCDYLEYINGSDINNIDSDEDGLNDYYELYHTLTDPKLVDSDNDGVDDPNEDIDEDGLANIDELKYNTDSGIYDTDDDGLSDGDEVLKYHTNPLKEDTDGDSLTDYDETVIGTNPLIIDSDGNGISDDKEKNFQTYEEYFESDTIEKIQVQTECTGNIESEMEIESVKDIDIVCSGIDGIFGEPYEFDLDASFEQVKVLFYINDKKLEKTKLQDLMVLWYDEKNESFVEMDTFIEVDENAVGFLTTHFSKYIIVDKNKWYSAWKLNADYTNGKIKYNNHNTVLAIDCSGSMRSNDPIKTTNPNSAMQAQFRYSCERIKAANEFVNNREKNDLVGIVLFDDIVKYEAGLTKQKSDLTSVIQKIYNNGGTNFNTALSHSMSFFTDSMIKDKKQCNRIILLSDGKSSCNNNVLEEAKRKGIIIHTVGLGDNVDEAALKNIAAKTEGEYYKAYFAEELVDIYTGVGIMSSFDKTDTDKDGLYDVLETAGIRMQNGKIIYTDPTKKDTDGDGLIDGEEIDPVIKRKVDLKNNVSYYFRMISDPNKKDGDGDGYSDYEETKKYKSDPLNNDFKVISLKNKYISVYYEGSAKGEKSVDIPPNNISFGGDQGWFYNTIDNPNDSYGKVIEGYGCGLISISDVAYYISKTRGIKNNYTKLIKYNKDNTINYDNYLKYVKKMDNEYYGVIAVEGLDGVRMAIGTKAYFKESKIKYKVSWMSSGKKRLKRIKDMIKNNIPVTLSVGPALTCPKEDRLPYYSFENENAIKGKKPSAKGVFKDHYVTVTGIYEDKVQNHTYLEISTWGQKYYIDYIEYIAFVNKYDSNSLSNILYIH